MSTEDIKKLVNTRIKTFDALLKNPKALKRNRVKYDAARAVLVLLIKDIDFIESTDTNQ